MPQPQQPSLLHRTRRRALLPIVLIGLTLALGACAGQQAGTNADSDQNTDPYESTNRFFYSVDDKLDRYALKPLAQGYIAVLPAPVRGSVHNALANLTSPVLFGDDISQGNARRAGTTLFRFVVNSTIGGLGLFDVASSWGIPGHETDFGVTLAVWGIPSGPFLYLPLLGPSSPRALVGYGADIALDPFTWVPRDHGLLTFNAARNGLGIIDLRARLIPDLDRVKAGALDPYATYRSLYEQNLASKIEAARHDSTGATQLKPSPAVQPGQPTQ